MQGWQLFVDPEQIEVNLLIAGQASAIASKYIIQNIAETRKDCIAFVSPERDVVVNNPNVLDDILEWRNDMTFNVSSSYGALDSGWKYQYDQYNDVYRWVPLNADMAGLHARTDDTNDPWWAAGGLNRGQIKNVVKLSWNPGQTARDRLYQAGINPVTSFPGQGIVLFGNKTLLAKPSAFDRINVRRLFIVLEKAISRAARYFLFEFNDAFTRAQFKSMVEPYLRMVQGRRGVTGFKVVCDETNNTDYIVSTNQFVADIFIRPNYSAEFITLSFIATNNSALFTEQG
jgi:phage tail sheath protein FI